MPMHGYYIAHDSWCISVNKENLVD